MLKLKLQYFDQMQRTDSLEKTLMLGKIEGGRRRGWQQWDGWMASLTWWTWVWINSGSWWWTGRPGVLQVMQRVRHDWATELNWTAEITYSTVHPHHYVPASTSVPPMNTQDWSPLEWTVWISLQSKGLSRVFSTTVQSINSSALSFLHSPILTFIHDHWKNHSLD